jgi:hypothetical protein
MMSRITSTVSGLGMLLLISLAPASADQGSLLIGTWRIDVSKLTMPSPPKSVTIVFADVGAGRYKMNVEIVDHDGAKRHGVTTFKPDGTPSPAVGNADYDVVSMTMPNRRILVMGGEFQGHPANTRVFSLSDDGKHMIETVVSNAPDGTPHTRVDLWTRTK